MGNVNLPLKTSLLPMWIYYIFLASSLKNGKAFGSYTSSVSSGVKNDVNTNEVS